MLINGLMKVAEKTCIFIVLSCRYLTSSKNVYQHYLHVIQGIPKKKTFSIPYFSKTIHTVTKCYIPVIRYIIYHHLCKSSAQLLLYILSYCVKTESIMISFPLEPEFYGDLVLS